ncbi:hypothetical protein ARMA_0277 [Ardenticatena maritima]|uniref:Uncharacterized protein n=1 Tax=Ardenticatena maritima TaxID=872965 RepID=A0A0M9UBH6_9CHLR|nr:hypothetical protein [Ardenticatena maritima]KPL87955.1 hypothetical protein SE16_10555 [Ardenticatena maritima]GAP61854.1 hypothetical protein ARMA_0277 [Ardenticatena maritima]
MERVRAWVNAILGRNVAPAPSQSDRLFALNTAQITMEVSLGLKPTGVAAIVFKALESAQFARLQAEIRDLLKIAARETQTVSHAMKDTYGYWWIVFYDDDFEELVAAMHLVTSSLEDQGFGPSLLAAVFEYVDEEEHKVYMIYNFKRGRFYPFVPTGGKTRDTAREFRIKAVLANELPIEPDTARWYPLWDLPLQRPQQGGGKSAFGNVM